MLSYVRSLKTDLIPLDDLFNSSVVKNCTCLQLSSNRRIIKKNLKRASLTMALSSSSLTFLTLLFWLLSSWFSLLSSMLSLLLAITIAIEIYFIVSHLANLLHLKCLVTFHRWLLAYLAFHSWKIFAFYLFFFCDLLPLC